MTCSKPDIANGVVRPANNTVDFESDYTLTCNEGYNASSMDTMYCTANGTLDVEHTCDSKPLNYSPLVLLTILAFNAWLLNTSLFVKIRRIPVKMRQNT